MSLREYSGLTAKIRAMSGKLMTDDDYKNIIRLNSVDDFVSYLFESKGYQNIFKSHDYSHLHRDGIEAILRNSVYQDFVKLYQFSNANQRKYLELYVIRYEVSILKTLIRHIYNPDTLDTDIALFRDFFLKFSKFDIVVLNACKTINDLIENLSGSRFYNTLSRVNNLDNPTMFDYESTLDMYYFTKVWKSMNKYMHGIDLKMLTDTYGKEIDLLNIRWIYRSKKYYSMDKLNIYKLILPIHYKLKKNQLISLVEADSTEEFYSILKNTYYKKNISFEENINLEDIYLKTQKKINTSGSKKNPYSIAIINYYLYRKEEELRKLTTLLEGIRYSLSQEELSRLLVTG